MIIFYYPSTNTFFFIIFKRNFRDKMNLIFKKKNFKCNLNKMSSQMKIGTRS